MRIRQVEGPVCFSWVQLPFWRLHKRNVDNWRQNPIMLKSNSKLNRLPHHSSVVRLRPSTTCNAHSPTASAANVSGFIQTALSNARSNTRSTTLRHPARRIEAPTSLGRNSEERRAAQQSDPSDSSVSHWQVGVESPRVSTPAKELPHDDNPS